MIGLAVGLLFGIAEFFLLTKLVSSFLKGETNGYLYVLAKVGVLALALAIGALFLRDQLVTLGVGVVAPLIIGSIVLAVKTSRKVKKSDPPAKRSEAEPTEANDTRFND